MSLQRYSFSVVTLVLVFGLSTGVLIHAAFPHEHGESGSAASIWQGLHAALRHEDKKTFLVVANAPSIAFTGTDADTALAFLVTISLILYTREKPFDTMLGALRRGILPYRKFG